MTRDVAAVLIAYGIPLAAVTGFAFLWRWLLQRAGRDPRGRD